MAPTSARSWHIGEVAHIEGSSAHAQGHDCPRRAWVTSSRCRAMEIDPLEPDPAVIDGMWEGLEAAASRRAARR